MFCDIKLIEDLKNKKWPRPLFRPKTNQNPNPSSETFTLGQPSVGISGLKEPFLGV